MVSPNGWQLHLWGMNEIWLPLVVIAGYVVLMRFVLPKFGVPT